MSMTDVDCIPVCVNGQANKTVTKDANNDDADEQGEHQDVMWTQEKVSVF